MSDNPFSRKPAHSTYVPPPDRPTPQLRSVPNPNPPPRPIDYFSLRIEREPSKIVAHQVAVNYEVGRRLFFMMLSVIAVPVVLVVLFALIIEFGIGGVLFAGVALVIAFVVVFAVNVTKK
jgi:hypothetical protein